MQVKVGFYAKTHFPIIWDSKKTPHCLVSGPTGSGKSVLSQFIVQQLLNGSTDVYIADYKAGGDWDGILPPTHYGEYKGCDDILNTFYSSFEQSRKNKEIPKKEKYLVFDELNSFVLAKDSKGFKEVMEKLGTIAFLGRSYKHFLLLVGQRFDSTVLNTSIREQLGIRAYVGSTISKESASMLFPNCEIDKSKPLPRFCGYVSTPERELDILQVPFISRPDLLKELLIEKGKVYF